MQKVDSRKLKAEGGNSETHYWQGQLFTGIASVLRPDGTLWGEIEYVVGRRYKIIYDWYPSGRIKVEMIYRDVLRPDGSFRDKIKDPDALRPRMVRRWFASGQMEYEAFHDKGTLYGPRREWDEDGQRQQETIFEYNYPVRMRMWDKAGKLICEQAIRPDSPSYSQLQDLRERYDKYLDPDQKAWVDVLIGQD